MLKRGFSAPNPAPLLPTQITVIESDAQNRDLKTHPVGLRYRALFGECIDFRTEGFGPWLQACQQSNPALLPGLPARTVAPPVPVASVAPVPSVDSAKA